MNPRKVDRTTCLAPYQPLQWQIAPWRDKSPVVLLAGPAGTGKSRLAAEKIHAYLLKYPRSTGVALRKTRQSMANSTILFLDRSIIGQDPRVRHIKTEHRFEYFNGSILAYGGMADEEQREQIRSIGIEGGIDILWMEEAIRFVEDDFNECLARMRGKAAPWQQILLCTNPGPPSHWIHRRLMLGGLASVYDKARPEDNPYNPSQYIENLKMLTGILKLRLWDGKWVQAEGLVYADFDLDNLTDELPDPELPFELAFDDGYIDPRAILFIQRQANKILVFDELYHTKHLAERCVREVLERCIYWAGRQVSEIPEELRSNEEISRWCRAEAIPLPDLAVGSPEAKEMQQRLRLADIPYRSKPHEIVEGISVVRGLICDGNDYRTLRVHRGNCPNLVREITEGYQYPAEGKRRDGEKPLDGNDHAVDSLRYWAWMRAR